METSPFLHLPEEFWRRWADVDAQKLPEVRRRALLALTRRPDLLPGPVFFDASDDRAEALPDAIIEATEPFCACGRRRLLVPRVARKIVRSLATITIEEGSPRIIVPWGGNATSPLVRFEVNGNQLVLWRHRLDARLPTRQIFSFVDVADLLMLADRVFYFEFPGKEYLQFPLCAVTNVSAKEGALRVTVVLDAALLTFAPAEEGHNCRIN